MDLFTFRDTIRRVSPPWLRSGNAEKVLYAVGLHLDFLIDAAVAAIHFRFPGYYSPESLPLEGRQRRIPRGRYESDATYANRLTMWLDLHRLRGNPYGLLMMLHAHFAPNNFPIELIYASGRRFMMAPDGTITWDDVAWTPPGDPAKWARWWLFYHHPPFAVPPANWDDPGETWDSGKVWGSGLSGADVADFKMIPIGWGNAHSIGHLVLLDEGENWDSYEPGAWPRQIALAHMPEPLTPVDDFDIDTVIPPETGEPQLAGVITAALQKLVNSALNLRNRLDAEIPAEATAREALEARLTEHAVYNITASGSGFTICTLALATDLSQSMLVGDIDLTANELTLPIGRWWIHIGGTLTSSYTASQTRSSFILRRNSSSQFNAAGRRFSTNAGDEIQVANGKIVNITSLTGQKIDVAATTVDSDGVSRQVAGSGVLTIMRVR